MPHRGTHQAAGKGVPRPTTKLYDTKAGPLTWRHWQELRSTDVLFFQIEEAVLELSQHFPRRNSSNFRQLTDEFLGSDEMTRLISLMRNLPLASRPRRPLQPLETARFALILSGRLLNVRT